MLLGPGVTKVSRNGMNQLLLATSAVNYMCGSVGLM